MPKTLVLVLFSIFPLSLWRGERRVSNDCLIVL